MRLRKHTSMKFLGHTMLYKILSYDLVKQEKYPNLLLSRESDRYKCIKYRRSLGDDIVNMSQSEI